MAKGEEFNCRNIIAELYHAGNCATEIIKATGCAKSTVYRIVSCLKAGKEVEHKPHNSRSDIKCKPYDSTSDIKRTPCFLAGLKHSIKPICGNRWLHWQKSRNVSKMTISKAIRVNLNMYFYVRRHRNILTAHLKKIAKETSAFLLNHLKNRGGIIHFFIHKKKFVVNEVAKQRNSRVIALNPFYRKRFSLCWPFYIKNISTSPFFSGHLKFLDIALKIGTMIEKKHWSKRRKTGEFWTLLN